MAREYDCLGAVAIKDIIANIGGAESIFEIDILTVIGGTNRIETSTFLTPYRTCRLVSFDIGYYPEGTFLKCFRGCGVHTTVKKILSVFFSVIQRTRSTDTNSFVLGHQYSAARASARYIQYGILFGIRRFVTKESDDGRLT